jgi:transcriptional regulator with XRE-family HTH domain
MPVANDVSEPGKGAELLARWRANQGLSQTPAAKRIGIAQSAYHGYESGDDCPKADAMFKIKRATGIDFVAWVSPDLVEDGPPTAA